MRRAELDSTLVYIDNDIILKLCACDSFVEAGRSGWGKEGMGGPMRKRMGKRRKR